MAGIEQLEIHSRSYIVRWIRVEESYTISWSVQPHKKSINFGIVKHPGSGAANLSLSQYEESTSASEEGARPEGKAKELLSRIGHETAEAPLKKKGFKMVNWHGRCEADQTSVGTYDVPDGEGGMYGLVFDNSFSKQTSKTATFVLLMYPVGSPPQTTNTRNMRSLSNVNGSKTSLGRLGSPRLGPTTSDSMDSLHSQKIRGRTRSEGGVSTIPADHYMGILWKRRRKKGQGYARRFFSLDYATCTLSYFHDRNSSALRGAIPLNLAAIAADERRREISIDSGAEIWHLRAPNDRDFTEWAKALEKSSRTARGLESAQETTAKKVQVRRSVRPPPNNPQEEDQEWQQVEALVSRIVGTRDALQRLLKDMAAHKHTHTIGGPRPATPTIGEDTDYFGSPADKRPFWKRKSSAPVSTSSMSPGSPSTLMVPSLTSLSTVIDATGTRRARRRSKSFAQEESSIQTHCNALLGDLDSTVQEFSNLLSNSKRRRKQALAPTTSRKSIESTGSAAEEFFDAEAGETDSSQLLFIGGEDATPASAVDEASIHESSSISSNEDADSRFSRPGPSSSIFPTKSKTLTPLPIEGTVKRRTAVPPSTVLPPSLIAFVRKNVGKDLSTISMPVSANEPTSLLQRVAEQLEYADLLDAAANQRSETHRLLHVAAFAISSFSSSRAKERAIRKPFNPLLGETFELVRSNAEVPGSFRLLVEKVSHRPVRIAMQADAARWSFAQSPAPSQKFWGKSAEITTEGRVRVVLRLSDTNEEERYSWTIGTVFLRNIVMGVKFTEPVGTMTVVNESTNAKAVIEFLSKGMFGGRSEEVVAKTYDSNGKLDGDGLTGSWTSSLRTITSNKELWRVSDLADSPAQMYGMTAFAASLNEITQLEKGRLPITDTRLRPDQRMAEEGKLEDAELWKTKLEEAQRTRRKKLEDAGEEYRPRWFVKAVTGQDGEEVWRLKGGKEGYWEERATGKWTGLEDLFSG